MASDAKMGIFPLLHVNSQIQEMYTSNYTSLKCPQTTASVVFTPRLAVAEGERDQVSLYRISL